MAVSRAASVPLPAMAKVCRSSATRASELLGLAQQVELALFDAFAPHQLAQRHACAPGCRVPGGRVPGGRVPGRRVPGRRAIPLHAFQVPVSRRVALRARPAAIADVENFFIAPLVCRFAGGDIAARHAGQVFGTVEQFIGQHDRAQAMVGAAHDAVLDLERVHDDQAHGRQHRDGGDGHKLAQHSDFHARPGAMGKGNVTAKQR